MEIRTKSTTTPVAFHERCVEVNTTTQFLTPFNQKDWICNKEKLIFAMLRQKRHGNIKSQSDEFFSNIIAEFPIWIWIVYTWSNGEAVTEEIIIKMPNKNMQQEEIKSEKLR